MVGSGVFVALFGMGYFWDVHTLSYYVVVSVRHEVGLTGTAAFVCVRGHE